ncbi:hypothetical protein CPC08DRAFT_824865 [Agrocybe pediades]|nr:hypothetical protein CPC08DRAFT_824865 [Agrocybe pediades]
MSTELDIEFIHAQTCAIFEELYDARGEPDQIDDSFFEEYVDLVKARVVGLDSLDDEPDQPEPRGPHKFNAKLGKPNSELIDVEIPVKNEKFLARNITAVKSFGGTSQRIGSKRGKGTYKMSMIKKVPNITITTSGSVVTCIGLPTVTVTSESGKGEWVPM